MNCNVLSPTNLARWQINIFTWLNEQMLNVTFLIFDLCSKNQDEGYSVWFYLDITYPFIIIYYNNCQGPDFALPFTELRSLIIRYAMTTWYIDKWQFRWLELFTREWFDLVMGLMSVCVFTLLHSRKFYFPSFYQQ